MTTESGLIFDLANDIDGPGYAAVQALDGSAIRVEQWNHEASWDSIRHYALGLGDDNPLFCDPGYAEATPYGSLLAPPTFLYTAFDGAVGAGLPGVQPIYAGTAGASTGACGATIWSGPRRASARCGGYPAARPRHDDPERPVPVRGRKGA